MAEVVKGARNKELGAWRENGEDKLKCSLNAVKSASRTMSTTERVAAPNEANKVRCRLDKRPYLRALCSLKTRSHSRTLST